MPETYKTDIAPLTVLPFAKSVFSYATDEKLSVGTLVRISFAGRNLVGVVVEPSTLLPGKKPLWLKNITDVIPDQHLTEPQVALAKFVSQDNFTPLSKVLKTFVPKKVTARTATLAQNSLPFSVTKTKALPDRWTKITRALANQNTAFVEALSTPSGLQSLLSLVQKLSKKTTGQILVLVPEIILLRLLEKLVTETLKNTTVATLHSHLAAGSYFYHWQRIQSGEAKVIFATRQGLFAPFKSLSYILQIEPGSESYKQWDMSPRYHAESVLPLLQTLYGAKLLQFGVLPPLKTLQLIKSKKAGFIPLAPAESNLKPEYVNLRLERYQKNFSSMSQELTSALEKTLGAKQQAILFVHQGGLESFSVCKECKTLFACPECHSPLRLSKDERYACKRCGFQSKLFPSCPSCQGIEFKSVGFGTQKVMREVEKRFPWARVLLADKSVFFSTKTENVFFEKLKSKPPDIVICTEAFLRFSPLPALSLVAIIDADSLLSLPGIERDERFLTLLKRASVQMVGCKEARLLVQTFHPENLLFRATSTETPETLLENILEEREMLAYPPFTRGIHINVRPRVKGSPEALKKLFEDIQNTKTLSARLVNKETKKGTRESIVIRYTPPLSDSLNKLLARYADSTIIDHDPLTFF